MIENVSWARRVGALLVDWIICTIVVILIVGWDKYTDPGSPASYFVLVLYIVESALLTWRAGGSIGKLLTGLCVVPADGHLRRIPFFRALGRQVLISLVIPPLVFKPDGRGLHDLFAGTSTVTFKTLNTMLK